MHNATSTAEQDVAGIHLNAVVYFLLYLEDSVEAFCRKRATLMLESD